MTISTDLNVPPYNIDHDANNNYHAVLFRANTAVQAREPSEVQMILQEQIARFGNHVFKDGSIVQGVAITYHPNVHYISLEDTFLTANGANSTINPSELDSTLVITNSTNSNTAIRATIKIAKDGVETDAPETNRLYLDYIVTGSNGSADQYVFEPNTTLYIYSENQNKFGTLDANNLLYTVNTLASNGSFTSNGYAYCMTVTDGLIFQKGYFTRVEPQTIAVRDFTTNTAGYVVGFDTTETIITENEDEDLFDNSLGYPNVNAPGAHRLQLTPTLISKTRVSIENTNFFSIVEFDGSEPTEQKDLPDYNTVGDQIAQRTYEESGDYAIIPFQVEPRVNSSNTETFYYDVSPGVSYVRGHRIEKIALTKVEASKASTTAVASNIIATGNYGNYVVCNEFLGAFNVEGVEEVSLYDAAQEAISGQEGISASPSGSVVGKANVRAIVFEDGTKGLPEATYLIYLFNIRMNSGKSFTSDVKSIYFAGSLGNVKADLVLENDVAVLKESTKTSLVFSTGLSAIKRLTDNTGVGDSSYVYNQIKTGTILTNGNTTITIDTAAPGASAEKLNHSVGSLSAASREEYNVILSANAYTANLTGTIAFTSGNVVITGTSTLFGTQLTTNSNIRIYANTTQTYVRRVVSINSNTSLVLDAPIVATANALCNFGEYFVDGTVLPLSGVTVTSNTSFTAVLGKTLNSTQTVYCSYPVKRSQTVAIPKVIKKNRFLKIDCSNNAANSTGPWVLGVPDAHKIRHVYVGASYSNTNTDRASWFTLDSGQRDDMYDLSRIVVKPAYAPLIQSSDKFLIEFDHFTANTAASVGFFSVESYPIDDANTSNTTAIQTIEIPRYGTTELRNVVDFRPYKSNTAASSTTEGGATINPVVTANSFAFSGTGQYMIMPDTNFEGDFEYYLPRYDLITINSVGDLAVKRGIPDSTPRIPMVENDQMVIAEAYVPPYPSATPREFETYKNVPFIRVNSKSNRRYTMRDIGVLDERIKRMEYYTVLNVLEQQARDLTIPDVNGLNRFKNGIFADPFNSHNLGNVSDFEYRIAIDKDETVARPYFQAHDVDLIYIPSTSSEATKSANVVQTGPLVTLNYEHEAYIRQNFATKYRVATEASWQWNGLLALYPSFDLFRDEQTVPNTLINLDFSSAWEQFANSPWGSMFGTWRTTGTTVSADIATERINGGTLTTTTTTNTTTQEAMVQQLRVNTLNQTIDLGAYVKDISISPYMRSRLVAFVSSNMKPRTTLHAFFDDVNVDAHVAPGTLSGVVNPEEGLEDRVVTQSGDFGSALVSDSSGFICGVFRIPERTFRTGDRVFMLTNVVDLTTGSDARISIGRATYTADNVAVTKSSTTIAVRQPQVATLSTTQRRLLSSTSVSSSFVPDFVPTFGSSGDGSSGDGGGGGGDPIAQSFTVQGLPDSITGVYLTKVGLYFRSKDNTMGCSVFVCEMENNMPDQSRIVGQAHLPSASITASRGPSLGEALVETQFTLDFPIYLMSNKDYAFFVQPDGNSPNYALWISETGNFDVTTSQQVFSNPYSGMMFISANRKTWTPMQKEDIAFNLYRARFTESDGSVIFRNENDEYLTVDGFQKPNTSQSIAVGDAVYTINSSANTSNVSSIVSNTIIGLSGRVQYVNEANGEIWLDWSFANSTVFFSNTTNPTIAIYRTTDRANAALLTSNSLISYANITSVDNLIYHSVVPKFGVMQPARTSVSYGFKGTSLTNTLDTAYQDVVNDMDYQYKDNERHVMSKSNEIQVSSAFKSAFFSLNMTSTSDFVSPALNLSRKGVLFVENLINDDVTNEHTRYGNALSKYVSKRIILDDGQESEDLQVRISANRPNQTDIKVYAKFWNPEDPEAFDDKVWTELQYDNGGELVYTSATNTKEFIEYKFSVPSINAVAMGAFANVNATTTTPLAGTISVSNNSNILTGTGTSFTTDLSVGDRVRIVAGSYYAVRTVVNITNTTSLSLDNGLLASNSSALYYAYDVNGNEGIVEYTNSSGSRFIGYKELALKIVLTSQNPVHVPRLNDARGICLQI